MSSRETAFAALLRVEDGAYSNVVLPAMLRDSALDPRDRAFATSGVPFERDAPEGVLRVAVFRASEMKRQDPSFGRW